ncbi:putative vegetative incompatibility protein HET-E-1, partial [Rhizoctonia solani 123E]
MPYCAFIRKLKRCKLFRRAPSPTPKETQDEIKPGSSVDSVIPNPEPKIEPKPPTISNGFWSECSSTLRTLVDCIYPGVLSPLGPVMKTFLEFIESMEEIPDIDEDYNDLVKGLSEAVDVLKPKLNNPNYDNFSASIGQIIKSITVNIEKIKAERSCTIGRRYVESRNHHNEIRRCWAKVNGMLLQLNLQLNAEAFEIAQRKEVDKLLKHLNPSTLALYRSEPGGIIRQYCTKDTRETVFQQLDEWSNTSGSHLFWMNGMAGTGKTTIAYTYAKVLSERQTPVICFFCSRVDPTCRNARHIIPTLVHQLTRLSETFRNRLGNLLRKDPSLAGSTSIPHQFENLLEAPFKGIEDQVPEGIVVIIDALDECDNPDSDFQLVKLFLDHLVKCAEGLPLKFLITSRPEPWIHDIIEPVYDKLGKHPMSLHDIAKKSVKEDIRLYLEQELASMSLPDEQLMHLVDQCDSLFLYAATLVRYIRPGGSSVLSARRLSNMLQLAVTPRSTIHAVIDELYNLVLRNALGGDLDPGEIDDVKVVLDIVVCANEPISVKTIAALSGLRDNEEGIEYITFALNRLRSVIYISQDNLVSVFHASFPEFMFDRGRAGESFYCPRVERNHLMAKQCFGLMRELRFNICQLDSSYAADKDTVTQSRVDSTIKPTLWYACRYWAAHLEQTTHGDLRSELKSFLSQRLLFWMEVLNLKGGIALGGDVLLRASLWLMKLIISTDADLTSLAEDARNFVTSFAANTVSISTPHIYTSLLPFCPRSSSILKYYRAHFQGLAEPDQHAMRVREVAALASWKREAKVSSVAYSHDGTKIAFGCLDGTVGVQSSYDGTSILDLSAHDKPVWSVAFSPPNKLGKSAYVASGSDDGTIRIWKVLDGAVRSVCRPAPLSGTADPGEIKSIAFSPKCDGNIASGSSDCTVCIWNSSNGELIAGPFHGHTGKIWAVAFSPDGALVASGSDDHTIRIWNPQNGQLVFDRPLAAQGGDINTIAFSPDGTWMASGSSDKTIC